MTNQHRKTLKLNAPKLNSVRMRDVDQLADLLQDWTIDSTQLQQGEVEILNERISFGDLTVERTRQNIQKSDYFEVPEATTVVSLIKPGSGTAQWCGFEISDDVMLVNQAGREHFARMPAGFEHVSIWISNELLEQRSLLPDSLIESSMVSRRAIIPLSKDNHFRRWLFNWSGRRNDSDASLSDQDVASGYRERLLAGLSDALDQGFAMQGAKAPAVRTVQRFRLVRRACSMIDERVQEAFSPEDLARELGVTQRTLQRGFGDVFDMSPKRYIQLRKLHQVRRELRRTPSAAAPVSRAAIKYGFTELGRFSVLYQKTFGERPSETLKEGARTFCSRT